MFNHLCIIFININLILLIKCPIVQSQKLKTSKEICIEVHSHNHLQVCYFNDISNHSSLVWFTIEKPLNGTFDSYRFIIRSIDNLLLSCVIIETLTNFTKLVDFNNSLRIFNLDSGQYEVCIEFQSNATAFIYQPRDGCIPIRIGKSLQDSFKQSSTPLLIALASGIVLFFILGLVVQRFKAKRRKQYQDEDKPRSRSSSILSSISLRQQRDRLARILFHRHIDQPRNSTMRQWARIRAFRHRTLTQEQEFERPKSLRRWSKRLFTSPDQSSQPRSRAETISQNRIPSSEPILTTNNIYTIFGKEDYQIPSRKVSFHLLPTEEYEMV
jgi:hypothetical protein